MVSRLVAALLLLTGGCLGAAPAPDAAVHAAEQALDSPFVVIALVDNGVNPYHEVFRREGLTLPAAIRDGATGNRPLPAALTLGPSFEENVRQDEAFWDSAAEGTLYHFEGTNLLAITFMDSGVPLRDSGRTAHGSYTSSLAAMGNPNALIVMVEAFSTDDDTGREARALEWVVEQPWIDVVSLSFGTPVPAYPGFEELPGLLRRAVESGKIVVAGAGNLPYPTFYTEVSGPPWSISVGGAIPEDGGEALPAAKGADFVSDYQARVAANEDVEGFERKTGTSLGTPIVAAEFSKVVLELKRDRVRSGGREPLPSPAEIREAFNRTAVYWNSTDFRGQNLSESAGDVVFSLSVPVLPAPWLQMGWGYVGPGAAERALAVLRGEDVAEKPAAAVLHMGAVQRVREAYWAARG